MNTMFRSDPFFVRIRDRGDRMELTVWNQLGTKIMSEFIASDPGGNFWNLVETHTSETVVTDVKERIAAR